MRWQPVTPADVDALTAELGRAPRGLLAVAYRCDHQVPAVVQTAPRLPGGTPFPTLYYLCCRALNSAVSRMEAEGVMREMTARLTVEPELAAAYQVAHEQYLAQRNAIDDLGIDVTAGGMPSRVKCLHVLIAHSLAVGRGVNPLGDEAVDRLPEFFRGGPPCARLDDRSDSGPAAGSFATPEAGRVRVAAVDCGTNSIRLLVADVPDTSSAVGTGPALVDVHREMRVVRLGEGVDATGRLSEAALDRTRRALTDYAATIRASGAQRVRMAATSATRDAQNRSAFVDMVRDVLGQEPEVITGQEEAALSFTGAVGELDPASGPFLVVDIGGGSTELVTGARQADGLGAGKASVATDVFGAISLDLGCVRLTERLLHSDPPTAAERAAAVEWVRAQLSAGLDAIPLADPAGRPVRRFVPVAGTATTVAAAALGLGDYDADRIHLSTVGFDRVRQVADFFLDATRAQRAALGYMHPGRVDVIGGGALILATLAELIAERTGLSSMTASEHDILDGLALSLA